MNPLNTSSVQLVTCNQLWPTTKRYANGDQSTPNTIATLMFQMFRKRSEPSRIHLLLNMPPRFWAAFFLATLEGSNEITM